MSARDPSTPGEWAAFYRQEWKALRGSRSHLDGLLASVRKTIAEWDAVVALERCPKGYRQQVVALGGVPTDHEYWWTNKQRPELRAELGDLRAVESRVERDLTKLA
jgi:hypothetical protein